MNILVLERSLPSPFYSLSALRYPLSAVSAIGYLRAIMSRGGVGVMAVGRVKVVSWRWSVILFFVNKIKYEKGRGARGLRFVQKCEGLIDCAPLD